MQLQQTNGRRGKPAIRSQKRVGIRRRNIVGPAKGQRIRMGAGSSYAAINRVPQSMRKRER